MKNLIKYTITGGLFLVLFIPFIVLESMFFPFITGKGFTFRIIVEIIFGLYMVLAFIDAQYRPKLSWITKSILLFTLAIFVSDLLSENLYKSFWSNYERMEGFVLIAHLVLYYIVASSVFKTRLEWDRFLNISIISSSIISLYGLFQVFGLATINQGGNRVDATFGNSSYLAIYLVFHIFLCLYMMAGDSVKKWKIWTYGGVVLLEMIILYYTATRGAVLGLLGGLILVGLLIAWKEKQNLFFRKISYYALAVVLIFIGIFFSIRNTSFVQDSFVLSRFSSLSLSEFKTQGRSFVWPMAVKGVMERPVFGWGQESFNFVFNKYYDPNLFGQEEWFDRTHNVFLDWLIAGGVVGFTFYASIYGALLYYIWRKDSLLKLSEKSIFTGLISAYIFHNIFVFDNLISYVMFFSVLAYIHSISVKDGNSISKFYTKTFSAEVSNYVIIPITIIFTGAMVYFVNIPALSANKTLIQAISPQKDSPTTNLKFFKEVYDYNSFGSTEATEQLVQTAVQIKSSQTPEPLKTEFYNLAKLKVEEKVKSVPNDARYLVFAGSFFNRFTEIDPAIKYLELALKESPSKQSIYFELGSSYLNKGNYTRALELFKKAYEFKPTARESQIMYAIGAIYAKNVTVLNELSKVIDKDVLISDDRILNAYANIKEYGTVINILNLRLQKDPSNIQNKLSLASVYATIGQKEKAISLIREIIKAEPTFKVQGEQYIKEIQNS